ncbi:biotin/lipoyl-containing protein [Sphingorhabdus lacus]|jgi:pyruvate/2-oxoglutarate dehydrogenase complex dihydrolipoamide acyltransferase (E2) component|uniref:Acyltransferase n=1 Tax=Sphingorhabdus lacus TaxID=392610 RepID=A0A6I6L9I8_9SPHN|nr:lipoyl domain-containing protein [Sphingorhabdus lacus]QGY80706.1 acyltransferase [Sphingorhabdus lacus]
MKIQLKLPRVGMNMEEATIVTWHKSPGETFASGDALYDFETEKVTQSFEASADGTLLEIRIPEGEEAQVGDIVCVVEVAQ